MHIYILGIGGTFMGSLAQLAAESGYRVSGCDNNVYSPMLEQLEMANIDWHEGFDWNPLTSGDDRDVDIYIIGNSISRGNPLLEKILAYNLRYTSGPQFLCDYLLPEKWVLACAGTHGKTTTSSMLAWVLDYAGMKPGFLIGGVPQNFGRSARMGDSDFFVIEADEYDSAFFDKRSKFIHYRPRTLILNNLEFDHADIFDDLRAIQKQCHQLVRSLSENTSVITPLNHQAIDEVLAMGCWSQPCSVSNDDNRAQWYVKAIKNDGSHFQIYQRQQELSMLVAEVEWELSGEHNMANAVSVFAAAYHVGVTPDICAEALQQFKSVKRRMEVLANLPNKLDLKGNITVYDDFAHHPTAISMTLEGLRHKVGDARIIAVIEPRSNTMKMGVHQDQLQQTVECADIALWYQSDHVTWSMQDKLQNSKNLILSSVAAIISHIQHDCQQHGNEDIHIIIMSNGHFEGIHQQLIGVLK